MKSNRPFRLLVATSLILSGFQANAGADKNKKIKESDDWSLWETPVNNQTVCYLQSGGENDYYFLILKNKNAPDSPVEIMVQLLANDRKETAMIATAPGLNSTMTYEDMDGGKKSFSGIPKNLTAFMESMKNNREIKVKGVGGKKEEEIKISTRGFKDMYNEMVSRCNNNQPLVSPEFENNFVNGVADNIDPLTKLDPTKISSIRSIYFAAYPLANKITSARAELAQVLVKYQPSIDEMNNNRATAGRLQNSDIPNAKNALAAAQNQQVVSRAELVRIDASIAPLVAKVQVSQKALDAAQAILSPLQPEYDRITGNLNSAQSTLAESQNRLAYVDTRLRDGAQQINSLESEARSLENWLPQKRQEAQNARSVYQSASSRRSAYNMQWERDSRLRNSFEYSRLQNDRAISESQWSQAQQQTQMARGQQNQAAQQLQSCRLQPIVAQFEEDIIGVPGDDGGGNLGPGPGGPDVPPQPRDCSAYEQAYNQATAQVQQSEQNERNAASRVSDIRNRLSSIERDVDYQVRSEYDSLLQREEQARRESDSREASVNDDENRVSQIRQADVPRLEREQTALSNERPTVLSRISDAQSLLSRSTQELNSFKASTGWDAKAGAVNTKQAQLTSDQNNLANAQFNRSNEQRKLDQALAAEAQIKAQIDSLNAQLAQLNARAAQLAEILKGLPAERAVVDQKLAGLETDLKARQQQMLDILK